MYSTLNFISDFLREMNRGWDVRRISNWADHILYSYMGEMDTSIEVILKDLSSMGFGKQFEIDQKNALSIAINTLKKYRDSLADS